MKTRFAAISVDRDERLQCHCVTAKCTYGVYLDLTNGAEENLKIQRSMIGGNRAYATLRSDLRRGCVLPPIVLAATVNLSRSIEDTFKDGDLGSLSQDFEQLNPDSVYVIDGLQRTNALRQTLEELDPSERTEFLDRSLRIEVWVNIKFGAIAYRMLLLNAGQRPMSVKHQVEILSSKLVDDLRDIKQLQIFRVRDEKRRTKPGQLQLAKVAQAFQAWLQGQPNLDLRNLVMEQLLAESAIAVLGQTVNASEARSGADGFHRFMRWLAQLDHALGDQHIDFLGTETVILGLSAAVGAMERTETLSKRVWPSLEQLLNEAEKYPDSDTLGLSTFESLKQGIDPSKINVGLATRDMVFNTFKEYIRGNAEIPMRDCWQIGAAKN